MFFVALTCQRISRWVASGKRLQLRRGLYAVADPYRKTRAHAFLIANRLRVPSYVSLQSALEFHGVIPEAVPAVTSVTTGRPERLVTGEGTFHMRHIKKPWFMGYANVDLGDRQTALVTGPEKALLDLIHLTPRADSEDWIAELRLQSMDRLDEAELTRLVHAAASPKLARALKWILKFKREEHYETP